MSGSCRTLVVIPTYNERENIEKLIGRLLHLEPALEVLIVDDNSPDGTGQLADKFAQRENRVHVLHRPQKSGIGPAYIAGFKWGLGKGYSYLIEMDADLSHRPRYLPAFLEHLKTWDVVVGSRWIPGGRIAKWAWHRVLLSRLANIYASWVLGLPIRDLTGGFNCYRREVLERIDLDEIHSDGYSFQIEMKYRTAKNHSRILEIPITFTDRKAGDSKISKRIVWEALLLVWRLKFTVPSLPRISSHEARVV